MHCSFEAAVKQLAGRGIGQTDIAEVVVTMGRREADVLFCHCPRTADAARFSEEFAMSAAVMLGHMGVSELAEAVVERPDMQMFYPKVRIDLIDDRDAREPAIAPFHLRAYPAGKRHGARQRRGTQHLRSRLGSGHRS